LNNYGLEVSPSTVTKWEAGERSISMEAAMRMCDVLGVEWSTLYQSPETTPKPEELIADSMLAIGRRYTNLVLNATHEVAHRVEEVAQLLVTSDTESGVSTDFIELAPEIAEQLRAADLLTRDAARGYSSATQTMIDLISTHHAAFETVESFDIGDIESYDPETGEFNDGSA
jgi:transcriptional regulator with XRE-family HTH domain